MLANKIFMSSKATLRNFNEIISKNVSYDTFKSKKKTGVYTVTLEKTILEKP